MMLTCQCQPGTGVSELRYQLITLQRTVSTSNTLLYHDQHQQHGVSAAQRVSGSIVRCGEHPPLGMASCSQLSEQAVITTEAVIHHPRFSTIKYYQHQQTAFL